jgi:Zn-dependent peptidase ImmA (M78 family)
VSTLDEVEHAACEVRRHWGLGDGPIDRLVRLVEDAGVIVIEGPSADRFDALSGRASGGFAVVVLNLARRTDRVRFDLALELGHLFLACHVAAPKVEEQLTHRFAAAFLVPASAARRELGNRRANLSETELGVLEQKYGLSVAAWTRRARDLSIIAESTYRGWQVHLRSQGQHVREAATYERDERPQRMRLLCLQALAEGVVDSQWAQIHCPGMDSRGERRTRRSRIQELLAMTPGERAGILRESADRAAADYATDPGVREWLDFDDATEPEDGENG